MKVSEVIKLLESNGWQLVRFKGSHRQFQHPAQKGTVTVAGHLNEELHKATWNSIQKQAGLKGKS